MSDECACGTPSKATWYTMVIFDLNGETSYTDAYHCAAHKPLPSDLRPEGAKILESKQNKLR